MSPPGVRVLGSTSGSQKEIVSDDALQFLAVLHRSFDATRKQLLQRRAIRQTQLDNGALPDFLPETAYIREDPTWQGPTPAPGLRDRRVEITGPVDRKMVINALNSGAYTYMADFEDSNAPTWSNNINGQVNLRDAIRKTVDFTAEGGKAYKLRTDAPLATLIVRPRGWHLEENHILVDGQPMSGSLVDFGLYFFHNAHELVKRGSGPYFYLPKMESHLEARLWNDVFRLSQDYIKMPRGTIRGTVLIETILAAFEMDEIIYELREHSSGLNCGRWDYIFSVIKKMRYNSQFILPDRADVTMTTPFMDAYVRLLIKTCHRRGVHAIGGMAALIPIKNDPKANDAAMAKVTEDKEREAKAGHDGTWVAHPALVKLALDVFNKYMPAPNQIHVRREDVSVSGLDLLNMNVAGSITEAGIRGNLKVALQYMTAWLMGVGCVPINNLMEDAATAEISRSSLWQYAYHNPSTKDGKKVTADYLQKILNEEADKLKKQYKPELVDTARRYLFEEISAKKPLGDFLTNAMYPFIVKTEAAAKI